MATLLHKTPQRLASRRVFQAAFLSTQPSGSSPPSATSSSSTYSPSDDSSTSSAPSSSSIPSTPSSSSSSLPNLPGGESFHYPSLPSSLSSSSSASASPSEASPFQASSLPNIPRPSEDRPRNQWRQPRYPLYPGPRPSLSLPTGFGANQIVDVPDETLQLLGDIVGSFRAPIRYAFAYGSGIFAQTGQSSDKGEKPMLDFIFATTHADHFHSINMASNPSHYPAYMRALGSDSVSWLQRHGGAGVWYNAYVPTHGVTIKYGVVTMDHLCKDLIEWQTLYLSGRMHKPIRIIRDDPRVKLANQVNLTSALRVALLTLPETFQERDLYERIAGLSYGGDPRMMIPGAENPRKVANIVDSQMDKFKGVYERLLSELSGLAVVGVPGGSLQQDHSPEHRASLARKLPKNLKTRIRAQYADTAREANDSDAEKQLWLKIGAEEGLGRELIKQTSAITRTPALTQSIKGIITAGPLKSLWYSSAKFSKWQKGSREMDTDKKSR